MALWPYHRTWLVNRKCFFDFWGPETFDNLQREENQRIKLHTWARSSIIVARGYPTLPLQNCSFLIAACLVFCLIKCSFKQSFESYPPMICLPEACFEETVSPK